MNLNLLAQLAGALIASDTQENDTQASGRELRFAILTTGAELCARLDQLVELDRRRVEALEKMLVLNEEESRAYQEGNKPSPPGVQLAALKAQLQAKSTPPGPLSSTAASTEGGEILSTEPSGGDSTST